MITSIAAGAAGVSSVKFFSLCRARCYLVYVCATLTRYAMKKNTLRVCEHKYRAGTFYFHRWTERGMTHVHPTEQSKDTTYVEVEAILESESTGEVFTASPSSITFID